MSVPGLGTLVGIAILIPLGFLSPVVWVCALAGVLLIARGADWRPRWTWAGAAWPVLCGTALALWAEGHVYAGPGARPKAELEALWVVAARFEYTAAAGCLLFLLLAHRQLGVALLLLVPGIAWFNAAALLAAMQVSNIWL